jgi:hypothetical protein
MEKLTESEQKIAEFIYYYPDVVVKILNDHGYDIDMATATLPKINELTYKAIIIDNNVEFAESFDNAMANDGYLNIAPMVIAGVFSLATSLLGGSMASKEAEKNRQLQKNIALAGFAQNELLSMEKIRSESATARAQILANTLAEYRIALQKEGTARIKDTWLYVTGLGIGIGIIFGIYLLAD